MSEVIASELCPSRLLATAYQDSQANWTENRGAGQNPSSCATKHADSPAPANPTATRRNPDESRRNDLGKRLDWSPPATRVQAPITRGEDRRPLAPGLVHVEHRELIPCDGEGATKLT